MCVYMYVCKHTHTYMKEQALLKLQSDILL
jgi:hypothetical protein